MPRGSYTFNSEEMEEDLEMNPRRDSSFKSFICILTVFLSACIIIVLVATLVDWKKKTPGQAESELYEGLEGTDTSTPKNIPDNVEIIHSGGTKKPDKHTQSEKIRKKEQSQSTSGLNRTEVNIKNRNKVSGKIEPSEEAKNSTSGSGDVFYNNQPKRGEGNSTSPNEEKQKPYNFRKNSTNKVAFKKTGITMMNSKEQASTRSTLDQSTPGAGSKSAVGSRFATVLAISNGSAPANGSMSTNPTPSAGLIFAANGSTSANGLMPTNPTPSPGLIFSANGLMPTNPTPSAGLTFAANGSTSANGLMTTNPTSSAGLIFAANGSTSANGLMATNPTSNAGLLFATNGSTSANGLMTTNPTPSAGLIFAANGSTSANGLMTTNTTSSAGLLFAANGSTSFNGLMTTNPTSNAGLLFATNGSTSFNGLMTTNPTSTAGLRSAASPFADGLTPINPTPAARLTTSAKLAPTKGARSVPAKPFTTNRSTITSGPMSTNPTPAAGLNKSPAGFSPANGSVTVKKLPSTKSKPEPVCERSVCNTAASRILSLMKHSVDPCEDFYEFACGGVASSSLQNYADLDDTLSTHLTWSNKLSGEFFEISMKFYETCQDYHMSFNYKQRIQKMKEILQKIGNFSEGSRDLTELFTNLILVQSLPLFDIGLDVDEQSKYILQLTIPGGSAFKNRIDNWSALLLHKMRCWHQQQPLTYGNNLNLKTIYDNYEMCQKNYTRYLNGIEYVLEELGVVRDLQEKILNTLKTVIFQLLADLPRPIDIKTNLRKKFSLEKVSDLEKLYPKVQWKKLLQNLIGHHNITDTTLVQVYFRDFLENMFKTLMKLKDSEINNALLAIFAMDLFENIVKPNPIIDVDKYCQKEFAKLFPHVVEHFAFLDYPQIEYNKIKDVTYLFDILKKQFGKSFTQADGVDKKTALSLEQKSNSIKLAFYKSSTSIAETYYKNYEIRENYPDILVQTIRYRRGKSYALQGEKWSVENLFSNFVEPLAKQPLIIYPSRIIVIPPEFVRKADFNLPGYLVMAQIGLPLARALARHFDPIGIKYDADNSRQLHKKMYEDYKEWAESHWEYSQYRIYQTRNISYTLNETVSLDERITENAAFRLISDSETIIKSGNKLLPFIPTTRYSKEKVFFIAAAQEYCEKSSILDFTVKLHETGLPNPLQVENVMGKSRFFSNIFACIEGAGMNLNPQKSQFPYLEKTEDASNYYDSTGDEDRIN